MKFEEICDNSKIFSRIKKIIYKWCEKYNIDYIRFDKKTNDFVINFK